MGDSLPVMGSCVGETPAVAVLEEDVPVTKLRGSCDMVAVGGDDEGRVGDWRVWTSRQWGTGTEEPRSSKGCSIGEALVWREGCCRKKLSLGFP